MAKRARCTSCWLPGMVGENPTTTNGPSYPPSHWVGNSGRRVRRSQTGNGVFKRCPPALPTQLDANHKSVLGRARLQPTLWVGSVMFSIPTVTVRLMALASVSLSLMLHAEDASLLGPADPPDHMPRRRAWRLLFVQSARG